MSNDISKLPKWAQDRIAKLEEDLRRWQDLSVGLVSSLAKRDPILIPVVSPPVDPNAPPCVPCPPFEIKPVIPPGVYAYMCAFPNESSTKASDTIWIGVTSNPPTGSEP
jgi:hypothetical protein